MDGEGDCRIVSGSHAFVGVTVVVSQREPVLGSGIVMVLVPWMSQRGSAQWNWKGSGMCLRGEEFDVGGGVQLRLVGADDLCHGQGGEGRGGDGAGG